MKRYIELNITTSAVARGETLLLLSKKHENGAQKAPFFSLKTIYYFQFLN
jgi:hypothetical protein